MTEDAAGKELDIAEIEQMASFDSPARLDLPSILILLINILLLSIFVTYLTNLIARSVQALLVTIIWAFFIILGRQYPQVRTYGWNWIVIGLNLIAFGLIISIFDHVVILRAAESLRENERYRLFLEQVIGSSLGFALLAYGFFKWVPSFLESKMVMSNYLSKLIQTVKFQKEELIRAEEKAAQVDEINRLKDFTDRIVKTIPSALLVLDRELRAVLINQQFSALFGVSPEGIAGKPLEEVLRDENLAEAARQAREEGTVVHREIQTFDEEREETLFTAATLSGEARDFVLCVFMDITERRRAELMEKQLQSQLLQSEKLSALGELVSGVAHELNNPLAIISGYSELLQEEETVQPETKELISEITKSSFRCKKIVENLLAFARQHKPEREFVDINQIVKDALSLRAHQFRVDNIAAVEELSSLPTTVADPHQLQQVFFNIINNAYQAMKAYRKEGGQITVRTSVEEDMIRVDIADNGPGMSDEVKKRIFDPFFTTKKQGEGTGLGLSITYGIIKEHKGTITVQSEKDQGATFIIALPITHAREFVVAHDKEAVETSAFEGKRVLVIDDEQNIADVCRMGLQRLGCLVEVADDGRDAISRLDRFGFDFIISDIRMPGLDGPAIYEAVREKNPALASRIIFMTGDTLSPETKEFLDSSGNLYLNKPFVMEELKAQVAKIIA